jgi:carboxylate-amine ligase
MPLSADHAFGSGDPFTLGVEEELFLVDPLTGAQANASAAVLERLGPVEGDVERELHATQVELITPVCARAREAADALRAMRRAVLATGAGLLGAGTHPAAEEGDAEITDKARYERIRELMGDAVADAVGGMHVHVGMPDAEHAIRAFNGLRRHLPLLQALAANSPYRHGRDTGLASAREITMRGWARTGVPRAMRDLDDFEAATAALAHVADVPDYTWFWWKLRPHPRLGTVEIRALDAQTSLDDVTAIAALAHCLAVHEATRREAPGGPPAEILDEASFRAGRYGTGALLPDDDGRLRPLEVLLEAARDAVAGHARELGCTDEVDATRRIVEQGGGAGRQRARYAIGGMAMLLRETAAATADV